MASMTTFSDRYNRQMKELHEYQKRLDQRLSHPRYQPAKLKSSPRKK